MSMISRNTENTTARSAPLTVSINTTTLPVETPSGVFEGIETGHDVVDPVSCTHFYTCIHARPVRKICPPTLVYNREARVCDFPRNCRVCENGNRPIVEVTTVAPKNSSTPSQSTEFPIFFTICQNATETPSSTGIGNTGFVPHSGSCIMFFRCEDRTVVERRKCVECGWKILQ